MVKTRSLFIPPVLALAIAVGVSAQAPKPTKIEVFKTATCGCCSKWVDHLKAQGFEVTFKNIDQAELDKVKAKYGVPAEAASCHTALVGSYVVEGHVPASEVKRLLKERPAVAGLAVPGMPLGSPGMESPGMKAHPYDVLSIDRQGRTKVFATIRP